MKLDFLWGKEIVFAGFFSFLLGGVHILRLQDLAFLTLSVYTFYGIKVYKKSIFFTTYPPPLVNVVCERSPIMSRQIFLKP